MKGDVKFLVVAAVVFLSCLANAGIYLSVDNSDAAIVPLDVTGSSEFTFTLAGEAQIQQNKYDLTIVADGGTLQELGASGQNGSPSNELNYKTSDLSSIGDILFAFDEGHSQAKIDLITNDDIVVDGTDAAADTIIYGLILFDLSELEQIVVFGLDYKALIAASQPSQATMPLTMPMTMESSSQQSSSPPEPLTAWFDDPNMSPDLNSDDFVNYLDFAMLADNWLDTGSDLAGDFDESGGVDANDLIHFAAYWLVAIEYPSDKLPYITSFEDFQGFSTEDTNLGSQDGWLVDGTGSAGIKECSFGGADPNYPAYSYQYLNVDSDTDAYKFFKDQGNDNSYIRINCIPTHGSKISIMNDWDVIGSIAFGSDCSDDSNSIYILDDGVYEDSSVGYQHIIDKCNTNFYDPNTTVAYDDLWVELTLSIDWANNTYDVTWHNWNDPNGTTIYSDAVFDPNHTTMTGLYFENACDPNDYGFKLNRLSVTSESQSGGVIGMDADIDIVTPTGNIEDGHIKGKCALEGSVWFDKLGWYTIKSCASDLDQNDSENWTLVDTGYEMIEEDIVGYWETSGYNNGEYLLKVEVYDDLGSLHTVGNISKDLAFNNTTKTSDTLIPIAGFQKAQTFHHQEKPDISVKWPGQFPFELTRTYNNNLRKYMYPFFYGWTHNHNIRLTENCQSGWITDSSDLPDKDYSQLGIGRLWLQTANGTRMFMCKDNTSSQSDPNVIYESIDNLGGFIVRTSEVLSTDPNGNPSTFDVSYVFHARDGSTMDFSGQVVAPYSNSTEGIVDWMLNSGIDEHSDRFGNALIYTWLIDEETNYPKYITKIENNQTDARIEFENNFKFPHWPYTKDDYTPLDLYSKAKLVVGEGANEEVLRTTNYQLETGSYIWYVRDLMYKVTREGDNLAWFELVNDDSFVVSDPNVFHSGYRYDYWDGEMRLVGLCMSGYTHGNSYTYFMPESYWWHDDWDKVERAITKHIWYYEDGRVKMVAEPTKTNDVRAYLLYNHYDYNYDSLGRLVTTVNHGEYIEGIFYNGYGLEGHNIPDPPVSGRPSTSAYSRFVEKSSNDPGMKLKDTITVQNHDGAVVSENIIPNPDAVYLEDLSFMLEGTPYIDTAVKNISNIYDDEDNPFKPTTVYEYFDDQIRQADRTYNSYGDILSQKTYADPDTPGFYVATQWSYHPKYGFETAKTTWQGYCQDDAQGDIVPSGPKVESLYIFGNADGTVDETNGKFLVQQKKLLDSSGSGTWAVTYFEYYDNGLLKKKTDPEGSVTYMEYDDNGNPKKVWYDATFDENGDPNSILHKHYYCDDIGQMLIEADNLGGVTVNSYDDLGRKYMIDKCVDPNATTIADSNFGPDRYDFDPTHDNCDERHYGCDPNGYEGHVSKTQYGYSLEDVRVFEILPGGGEIYMYTESMYGGRYRGIFYEDFSRQDFFYTRKNLIIKERSRYKPSYQTTLVYQEIDYHYDSEGRVTHKYIQADDGYDESRLQLQESSYYGSGKKKYDNIYIGSYSMPEGSDPILAKQTYYYYDHLDRLISTVVDPFGIDGSAALYVETRYGYDALGNRTYVIDPNNSIIFTDYDNANRKVREYFAQEPSYYFGLVDPENIDFDTTKSNAQVRKGVEYYDNDKVKSATSYDYDGSVLAYSEFIYDGRGRIVETAQKIDDTNYAVTSFTYYDEGVYVGDPTESSDLYHIQVTDAEGKDTFIGLDAFGKRERTLYPSGDQEILLHDAEGKLLRRAVWDSDYDQQWIDYSYDDFGKLTTINYPDTPDVNDVILKYTSIETGWVSKVIDRRYIADADQLAEAEGDIYTFDYDPLDNIRSYTYTPYGDTNTWTVDYEYNYIDNQKSHITVKDPYNTTIYDVSYSFDGVGRQIGAYDQLATEWIALFDYDEKGNRKSLCYDLDVTNDENFVWMDYAYNKDNFLTGFTTTDGFLNADPNFVFDASALGDIDGLGRLVSGTESLVGADGNDLTRTLDYSYDGLGQLLSGDISNIAGSNWWADYSYAKDGNISSRTINSNTVNFEYDIDDDGSDDSDLMTKIGDDTLGWDLNGNLNNNIASAFAYDWDNKLRFAVTDGNSIEIRYDPRGNRIYKAELVGEEITKETRYIVDIVGKLPVILCEIDTTGGGIGSLTSQYYYSNSQVMASDQYYYADPSDPDDSDRIDRYFYLHDRLGSVRQVIESVLSLPDLHLRLDETSGDVAYDYVGIGVSDANMIGSPVHTAGKYHGGLDLDGVDDYLWSEGYNNGNGNGSGSRSYAAWFKTTAADGTIMSWADPDDHGGVLGIYPSDGNDVVGINVYDDDMGESGYILGTVDVNDGQWHHVAAVIVDDGSSDVSEFKLYLDGVEERISASQSLPIDTCGYPLVIGAAGDAYYADLDGYFEGCIDEVRVYDRALSAGDVAEIAATDKHIRVINTYSYNPFGEDFVSDCNETVYNPFKFTGQWYDTEIAQYYLRARMYDPQLMRFTGRDPVLGKQREPLTVHEYLYCANEPINRTDRTGKSFAAGLVEPIMAGYSVHGFAVAVTATGVANSNWNIIFFGIALEKMVAPTMAISSMSWKGRAPRGYPNVTSRYNNGANSNLSGGGWNNLPKWAAVAAGLTFLAAQMNGCDEELRGIDEWMKELDDNYYFEPSP